MKMHDIHPEKKDVVLLMHPMLANAQMLEALLTDPMGAEYRYLIPDFSGHGDVADTIYHSAHTEAQQVAAYLREHHITTVQLAFGASMGGVILLELFYTEKLQIKRAFFEGTSFFEHADFMTALLRHVFVKKHRKAAANPDRAVGKMGGLYGTQAGGIMARQLIGLNEESLCNVVYDCGHVHLPALTATQQKNCVFAYGEKDFNVRCVRKNLHRHYPEAKLVIWPGCGHCTRITSDPVQYAAMLKTFLLTGQVPE